MFIGPNVNVVAVEHSIAVTTNRSKLHDLENQRVPKLALFECGMDVGLVLLMYDELQTMKLQLQLQVGEC